MLITCLVNQEEVRQGHMPPLRLPGLHFKEIELHAFIDSDVNTVSDIVFFSLFCCYVGEKVFAGRIQVI